MFFKEIFLHQFRSFLLSAEKAPDIFYQFFLISCPLPAQSICFYVLIQQLIRIQIRTIPGQIKNRKQLPIPGNPFANPSGSMCRVTVDNQEHFPIILFHQPADKIDKDTAIKLGLINHKRQMTSVSDRRDHITSESLPRSRHNRRLPAFCISSSKCMVRTHTGFVSPEYCRSLDFGSIFYPGIALFHPVFDFLRIPFVCSSNWFLRRKSPPCKITPSRPYRKGYAESALDQQCNCLPSPKHKWQFYLIGTTVGNRTNNLGRLPRFQASAPRTTARVGTQGFHPFRLIGGNPFFDSFPSNTKYFGNFASCFPIQNCTYSFAPDIFLRGWGQRAEVSCSHS